MTKTMLPGADCILFLFNQDSNSAWVRLRKSTAGFGPGLGHADRAASMWSCDPDRPGSDPSSDRGRAGCSVATCCPDRWSGRVGHPDCPVPLAAMAPPMLKPGRFRAPDKLLAVLSTAGRKPNYAE